MSGVDSSPSRFARRRPLVLLLVAVLLVGVAIALQTYKGRLDLQSEELTRAPDQHRRNAPYIVSPQDVVDLMLEVGEVDGDDVVYDLGCGDGRILIVAATRFGCRGVGYEYDPQIAELARQKVREAGVEHLITIQQMDIFKIPRDELNQATVVTLYLLDWMNKKLIPQLCELDEEKMIVSHDWGLDRIKPDRIERIHSEDDPEHKEHVVRAWRTPLNLEDRE